MMVVVGVGDIKSVEDAGKIGGGPTYIPQYNLPDESYFLQNRSGILLHAKSEVTPSIITPMAKVSDMCGTYRYLRIVNPKRSIGGSATCSTR